MKYITPRELLWFIAIVTCAVLLEFSIIKIFHLNPILSVKLQGFLGLMILGYGIRMAARFVQEPADPTTNGQK